MAWHDGLVESFPNPTSKRVYEPETETSSTDLDDEFGDMTLSDDSEDCISPFPLLSLPPELRNRIYTLILFSLPREPKCHPSRRLPTAFFLASSQIHEEASYVFYTSHRFRIYPIQEFRPLPTLFEVPPTYRNLLKRVQVVLGPGFTSPPPSLRVTREIASALGKLDRITCLDVFVALDPSHPVFAKLKAARQFPDFAGGLLRDLLKAMPQIEAVSIDRNPGVRRDGPLLTRLQLEIEKQERRLYWDDKDADTSLNTNYSTVCNRCKGCKEKEKTACEEEKDSGKADSNAQPKSPISSSGYVSWPMP